MEVLFLLVLILLMVGALISGFPVAFALPGAAILSITLAALCGFLFTGDPDAYFVQGGAVEWLTAGVTNFRSLYWDVERDTLIAIPLFIFMGIMLQRSKVAEDLLVAMARLFGPVPGGLGISVVVVGALLAATTGIVGATVVAMGLISLPAMMRNKYSDSLACGTICASGTLGQIIPPSIVLIILADQLASAASQASAIRKAEYKEATGEFSMPSAFDVSSASAGDMFMGALIPGLLLVGLYVLYILVIGWLRPKMAPPVPYEGRYDSRFWFGILVSLVPPLALIFVVLGSIILGVATVNQAGAIGAVGAILMGGYRLSGPGRRRYWPALIAVAACLVLLVLGQAYDLNIKAIGGSAERLAIWLALAAVLVLLAAVGWSLWRAYRIENTLYEVMLETAKTTSMVFIILVGAAMLTTAFRGFGGEELVKEFLYGLPGGFWTQFLVVMLVIFLLGFFLDFIEIAVVVVPIVAPILLANPEANVTAVWLGVMVGLNIQTSFLTPPFGFALFYLRGVADKVISTLSIYRGAVAFIGLQLLALAIVGFSPKMVNYLPNYTYLTSENAPPPINPRIQGCLESYVFEQYELQKPQVLAAIRTLSAVDMSSLPAPHAKALQQGLDKAGSVFEAVADVQDKAQRVAAYEPQYRPLHQQVRRINRELAQLKEEARLLERELSLSQRFQGAEADQQALQDRLAQIKTEQQALAAQIPESWSAARQQYGQLASAEKQARFAYRRLADSAYEDVAEVQALFMDADKLAALADEMRGLPLLLSSLDEADMTATKAATLTEAIKALESGLNEVSANRDIKAPLYKARRELRRDPQPEDFAKAEAQVRAALSAYEQELQWRQQAQAELQVPMANYLTAISQTIGLRQQPKLGLEQAEYIASCESEHRDISLNF